MSERPASWVRDHLANERTLLAWLRSALAFMAFGVALAKMARLLRVAAIDHPEFAGELPSPATSRALGAGLVALGGIIAIAGAVKLRRWASEIDPGHAPPRQRTLLVLTALSVLASAALVAYVLV